MKKKNLLIGLIVLVVIAVGFYFWNGRNGRFVEISNMNVARAYHKSISLNDGNVLITGGNDGKSESGLNSAEIFNIKANKFTLINNMNLPHQYHSMFKLTNGNIVIVDINGIELFDAKTNAFKLLKTKPLARMNEFNSYSFNLLPNNKILIVGGDIKRVGTYPKPLNKAEIIDLFNDKTIKTFDYISDSQGTFALDNGDILLVGGIIQKNNMAEISNEVNLFDSKTLEIKKIGTISIPVESPQIFNLGNKKILILGGNIFEKRGNRDLILTQKSPYVEIFDLKTNKPQIIVKNNLLLEYDINQILQINNNFLVFNINTKNGTDLKFFDISKKDFINKNNNSFNKPFYKQNSIVFKNKILLSGGEKIPHIFYRLFSTEMCTSNRTCVSNPTNKSFVYSIESLGGK